MEHLILHQVGFISYVMGKPIAEYEGRELKEAHQHHEITTASFELVIELLRDALDHAGVTEEDIETIIATAKAARNDIVSR